MRRFYVQFDWRGRRIGLAKATKRSLRATWMHVFGVLLGHRFIWKHDQLAGSPRTKV